MKNNNNNFYKLRNASWRYSRSISILEFLSIKLANNDFYEENRLAPERVSTFQQKEWN